MARQIQGSRILITGASSGIGKALAESCAREGARIALMARSVDSLQELAAHLKKNYPQTEVLVLPGDVTRDEDRRRVLELVKKGFGGLDVLINNAGVASFGHFSSSTEAVMRQVMEVNFFAPAELMRLAVPILVEGRQPAIVNVASMCGRRGTPAWPEYSASKFALCGLSDALRAEFARFDIDLLLIIPGLTQTNLRDHLLQNNGRLKIEFDQGMKPEYVADQIVGSLKKNRRETWLGWEARWILRINRWFPRLVDRLMARKVRRLYSGESRDNKQGVDREPIGARR